MDVTELASSFDSALSGLKSFGWPKHRTITQTHEQLAESLKDVGEIVKLVGNVVAYHTQVFEEQSKALTIDRVEANPPFGWTIVCSTNDGKELSFYKEEGSHGGRWRCGLFCKKSDVIKDTGTTADYLAGFEDAMNELADDRFNDAMARMDASHLYKVFRIVKEEYKDISIKTCESMVALANQAMQIDPHRFPSDIEARKAAIKYERRMRTVCREHGMPEVPKPMCKASDAKRVEATSGVYFEWDGDVCVYVGKAKNIKTRLSGHHKVQPTSDVSWIKFSNSEKDWAELFYIWLLRPCKNYSEKFGRED